MSGVVGKVWAAASLRLFFRLDPLKDSSRRVLVVNGCASGWWWEHTLDGVTLEISATLFDDSFAAILDHAEWLANADEAAL